MRSRLAKILGFESVEHILNITVDQHATRQILEELPTRSLAQYTSLRAQTTQTCWTIYPG